MSMRTLIILIALLTSSKVYAQPGPDEDAMVASNVCQGVLSEIARANGGSISATVGDFKISGANGSVTVSKGDRVIFPGMTYAGFVACLGSVKKELGEERKRSEIDRAKSVLLVAEGLNDFLSMGICLREPARIGLYFSEGSQGMGIDGMITETAVRQQARSLDRLLSRKISDLTGQEVNLGLEDGLAFFTSFQGRSIAYYTDNIAGQIRLSAQEHMSDKQQSAANAGFSLAVLIRSSGYYSALNGAAANFARNGDPRSQQVFFTVNQADNCLFNLYNSAKNALSSQLSTMGCRTPEYPQLGSFSENANSYRKYIQQCIEYSGNI